MSSNENNVYFIIFNESYTFAEIILNKKEKFCQPWSQDQKYLTKFTKIKYNRNYDSNFIYLKKNSIANFFI